MEALNNIVSQINGVVWGPFMLALILGVGLFLQVGLKFMPILRLGYGFNLLWNGRDAQGDGYRFGQRPDELHALVDVLVLLTG